VPKAFIAAVKGSEKKHGVNPLHDISRDFEKVPFVLERIGLSLPKTPSRVAMGGKGV
jgi:hypothetical protein